MRSICAATLVQFECFSFSSHFFFLSLTLSVTHSLSGTILWTYIPHYYFLLIYIVWFLPSILQQSRWLALFISRNGYDSGIHISIMMTKIRNCYDKWVASKNVGRQRKCLEAITTKWTSEDYCMQSKHRPHLMYSIAGTTICRLHTLSSYMLTPFHCVLELEAENDWRKIYI